MLVNFAPSVVLVMLNDEWHGWSKRCQQWLVHQPATLIYKQRGAWESCRLRLGTVSFFDEWRQRSVGFQPEKGLEVLKKIRDLTPFPAFSVGKELSPVVLYRLGHVWQSLFRALSACHAAAIRPFLPWLTRPCSASSQASRACPPSWRRGRSAAASPIRRVRSCHRACRASSRRCPSSAGPRRTPSQMWACAS